MPDAYLAYDPSSGEILSIGWNLVSVPTIMIDEDTAVEFIESRRRLQDYVVISIGPDSPYLSKRHTEIQSPITYFDLKPVEYYSQNLKMEIREDGTLAASIDQSLSGWICVTEKNDPSWLIEKRYVAHSTGTVIFSHPINHSFWFIRT